MRKRTIVWLVAGALTIAASGPAIAQGPMQIVPIGKINWVPCDPNAVQPDACMLAYFRGDPAKELNYKMLKAKAGFVFPPHWHTSDEHLVMTKGTIKIAAEDGQEQDSTLNVGDYLYIPARRVHWGSCPEDCIFYLYVDGPDSYIDAKAQRP
jgi:quercetin dioxygenase-like cupin family protein